MKLVYMCHSGFKKTGVGQLSELVEMKIKVDVPSAGIDEKKTGCFQSCFRNFLFTYVNLSSRALLFWKYDFCPTVEYRNDIYFVRVVDNLLYLLSFWGLCLVSFLYYRNHLSFLLLCFALKHLS